MVYFSPQLSDDILKMRSLQRPINDISGLVAQHGAQQQAATAGVESAGRRIGLGQNALDFYKDISARRLAQNQSQFNRSLGLSRDVMNYNRGQGNIAAGISGLGLGVSFLNDLAAQKRFAEQTKLIDQMLSDIQDDQSAQGKYFKNLLEYFKVSR